MNADEQLAEGTSMKKGIMSIREASERDEEGGGGGSNTNFEIETSSKLTRP